MKIRFLNFTLSASPWIRIPEAQLLWKVELAITRRGSSREAPVVELRPIALRIVVGTVVRDLYVRGLDVDTVLREVAGLPRVGDVVDFNLVDEQERGAVVGENVLRLMVRPRCADPEAVDLGIEDLIARVRVGAEPPS